MKVPYVGFSNETLAKGERLSEGDEIACPTCKGKHVLVDSKPPMLLTYKCGDESYLAAIDGRSIMGRQSDIGGNMMVPDVH